MAGLAIDDAAWSSRWRDRAVGDKVLLTAGLIVVALCLPPWPASVLVAAMAAGLAVLAAGTPLSLLVRALRAPVAFIVVGVVSVAVTITAAPSWSVTVTSASIQRSAELASHAVAGTLAVLLLALTTPMVDLLNGLRRLRVPDPCIEIASLMYRLLFILLDTTRTMRSSQAARLGFSTPRRSMRSAGSLTAAVLTSAWGRAQRLERGLAARGYVDTLATLESPPRSSRMFIAASLAGLAAIVATSIVLDGAL
jgi:cobalt/nickel transport system permease protein